MTNISDDEICAKLVEISSCLEGILESRDVTSDYNRDRLDALYLALEKIIEQRIIVSGDAIAFDLTIAHLCFFTAIRDRLNIDIKRLAHAKFYVDTAGNCRTSELMSKEAGEFYTNQLKKLH